MKKPLAEVKIDFIYDTDEALEELMTHVVCDQMLKLIELRESIADKNARLDALVRFCNTGKFD